MKGAPSNQATTNPQQAAHDERGPATKSQLKDAIVEWLRRYWDTPREKTKWPDIAIVILTLVIAVAAIWSAFIFQGQLTEARITTKNSTESFRTDERAWIEIQPITLSTSVPSPAFRYQLYPKNVGKTSATNIRILALRGILTNSITMGDNTDNINRLQDMLVNGAVSNIPRVNPVSKILAPNTTATVPFIMDGQAPQIFPKDELVSYLIGKIEYTDTFNVPHWLKFCFFVVNAKGDLWNCNEGNDEDHNPELPPN